MKRATEGAERARGRGEGAQRNNGHQRPRKVTSGKLKTLADRHRYLLTSQNENATSGFDSPHLHDVLKTFPQVSDSVTCGVRPVLTRF